MTIEALNRDCQCLPPGPRQPFMAAQPVFAERALRRELFRHVREIGAELERHAGATAAERLSGVCNSFDFHLTAAGPRLIEVNTNAGGAFLQSAIVAAFRRALPPGCLVGAGRVFRPEQMILDTWEALRPGRVLTRVAIVDRDPARESLLSDMQAAAAALRRHGVDAQVVALAELSRHGDRLHGPHGTIDFVYNRCTDFLLEEPDAAVLRQAWLDDQAVVAPNPSAYRVYADKRRLLQLAASRAAAPGRLEAVLPAVEIHAGNAQQLWQTRREWYFKPLQGYGSRGVLRGDGISRGRFEALADSGYLAQAAAPPATRTVVGPDGTVRFKYDIRVWTHGARPLFAAARLFRGQVTGMSQPGEGFAPIAWLPAAPVAAAVA
jgi:hypothetical protein